MNAFRGHIFENVQLLCRHWTCNSMFSQQKTVFIISKSNDNKYIVQFQSTDMWVVGQMITIENGEKIHKKPHGN